MRPQWGRKIGSSHAWLSPFLTLSSSTKVLPLSCFLPQRGCQSFHHPLLLHHHPRPVVISRSCCHGLLAGLPAAHSVTQLVPPHLPPSLISYPLAAHLDSSISSSNRSLDNVPSFYYRDLGGCMTPSYHIIPFAGSPHVVL